LHHLRDPVTPASPQHHRRDAGGGGRCGCSGVRGNGARRPGAWTPPHA